MRIQAATLDPSDSLITKGHSLLIEWVLQPIIIIAIGQLRVEDRVSRMVFKAIMVTIIRVEVSADITTIQCKGTANSTTTTTVPLT